MHQQLVSKRLYYNALNVRLFFFFMFVDISIVFTRCFTWPVRISAPRVSCFVEPVRLPLAVCKLSLTIWPIVLEDALGNWK